MNCIKRLLELLFFVAPVFAQSLTLLQIDSLKTGLNRDTGFNMVHQVLLNQQFNQAFVNKDVLRNHNTDYTHEIKIGKVADQKHTGRCWMYAGLNVVRHRVKDRLNLDHFEFSENYLFFWDKLEKANHFLEEVIARSDLNIRDEKFQRLLKSPMDDGGYWQNCVDLVKKYGCVPIEAMPEVPSTENSRLMQQHLTYYLRDAAYELKIKRDEGASVDSLRKLKESQLANVYRMLALHLGEPVNTFEFRYKNKEKALTDYKTYTPKSFAESFVEEDMGDYVMFANWPARNYGHYYVVESSNNLIDGMPLNFVNLPMDDIKKMMIESIKHQEPVNFSADVGKQMLRKEGVMHAELFNYEDIYGVPMKWDKAKYSVVQNIASTHAMVIIGVDLKNDIPIKWKVENSWGDDDGEKGIFHMYDNWVDLYVVRVVLHKDYVPQKYLDLFKQEPIVIPENEPEQ